MSEKFISYDNLKQYDEFLDKELNNIKDTVDNGFIFNVKYAESDEIGGAAIKAISDETGDNIAEHFGNIENDIAINKTTLGYQKKNLFPVNSKSMSANGWVMGNGGNNVYKLYIPKGEYIFTFKQTGIGQSEINFYDSTNTQITRILPYVSTANTLMTYKITLSSDCYGVKFYNNSGVNTYSEIMMRPIDITDSTFEPYIDDVDTRITENKNDIKINETTLGYTKKNLINVADVTIDKPKHLIEINMSIPKGKYICSYNTTAPETACEFGINTPSGATKKTYGQVTGKNSVELETTEDGTGVYLWVNSAGDYSDIMLRYADITDDTFEPYVESVNERLQNFVKSGSGAKSGLVPAPSTTAGTTKYLREDGTWQTPPDNNTHYTSKNVVGSKTATTNTTAALTNGNVYLNSVENGAVTSAHKISGSGITTVITDTSGNIIIKSTDTNTDTKVTQTVKTDNANYPLLCAPDGQTATTTTTTCFDSGVALNPSTNTITANISGNAGTATKLATARTIDGVSFDGSTNITHYGTCSTAAGTQAKDVTLSGFSLVTGARINVNFSNTNSADNITLNVNGTGAKPVFYVNSKMTARTLKLQGKHIYGFVYDGTNWIYEGDSSYSSQNTTTTNADYRVLLSHTDDDITERGVTRKSSKFTANPSTGVLTATTFSGNATSASKLSNTTAIGSATNPVYFNANGVPVACTYSLNKTVPSNAVFTDTNTKVTQTLTSGTGKYPLLLTPSGQTATTTTTACFAKDITLQPSTGILTATSFKSSGVNLIASGSVKILPASGMLPQSTTIEPEGFDGSHYSSLVLSIFNTYGGVISAVLPMNYLLSGSNSVYIPVHLYNNYDEMGRFRPMHMKVTATSTGITIETPHDGGTYWEETYNNYTYKLFKI